MPPRQQRRVATLRSHPRSAIRIRPSRRELCLSVCLLTGSQPPGGRQTERGPPAMGARPGRPSARRRRQEAASDGERGCAVRRGSA